jgi:hypothetical protein
MMRPMDDENALYLPDGDGFVATLKTQGGWDPNHQHGGPVQALMARAVEQAPSLVPMQVARLTHDLIRPVPIGKRLVVSTEILREGKRIQLLEVVMRDGDVEHARTRALRLREADLSDAAGLGADTSIDVAPVGPEEVGPAYLTGRAGMPGFFDGMELRRFQRPDAPEGVHGYWVRLKCPLIAGEETTPLQTMSVAGDFANMIGITVETRDVTFINPDLNVHVLRLPVGEWIAVMGDSRLGLATGIGVSTAQLRDRDGICALASNCQLIQRR